MTELEQKVKQSRVERERKYPMLDITDNRKEIREIAEAAQDYMVQLNPDVVRLKIWESIPRITMEFILAAFTKLDKAEAKKNGSTSVVIGDLMELEVQYTETNDADKFGNLTPVIRCRSEFKWENVSLPYHDEIPVDVANVLRDENCEGLLVQFYDNRKEIKEISEIAIGSLKNFGVMFGPNDWWIVPLVVIAFFRKTRDWLVEHKDDGELGVEIRFADMLKIGVSKEGGLEDDDPVDYILYIRPDQIFKKENAKGDDITEAAN